MNIIHEFFAFFRIIFWPLYVYISAAHSLGNNSFVVRADNVTDLEFLPKCLAFTKLFKQLRADDSSNLKAILQIDCIQERRS